MVAEAAKVGVTTLAPDRPRFGWRGCRRPKRRRGGWGSRSVPAIEMSCVHEYAEDLHVCGYWIDLAKIAPACERAQQKRRDPRRRDRREPAPQRLRPDPRRRDPRGRRRRLDRPPPHRPRRRRQRGPRPLLRGVPGPRRQGLRPPPLAHAEQAVHHPRGRRRRRRRPPLLGRQGPGAGRGPRPLPPPHGVEAFYPSHTEEQTKHLLALCDELGLVPTASSDYHGPTHKTFAKFGAYDTFGFGEPQVPPRPVRQQREDLAAGLLEVRRGHQVGALRRLVGRADAGQVLDLPRPRLRVEALRVTPFALLERGVDEGRDAKGCRPSRGAPGRGRAPPDTG